MSTARITPAQLRRLPLGSLAAHEQLQTAVLAYLRLCGCPAVPIHTGPRVAPRPGGGFQLRRNRAQHGMADVMACLPPSGRLALLELKSGGARRSPEQRETAAKFEAAGALCLVVRDVRELEPYVGASRTRFGAGGTETRKRGEANGEAPVARTGYTRGGAR